MLLTRKRARVLYTQFSGESGPVALAGAPVLDRGFAYVASTNGGFGDALIRVRVRDGAVAKADIGNQDAFGSLVWLGQGRVFTTRGGFIGPADFEGCAPDPAGCARVEILDGIRF